LTHPILPQFTLRVGSQGVPPKHEVDAYMAKLDEGEAHDFVLRLGSSTSYTQSATQANPNSCLGIK
jgi:hypothetical protein